MDYKTREASLQLSLPVTKGSRRGKTLKRLAEHPSLSKHSSEVLFIFVDKSQAHDHVLGRVLQIVIRLDRHDAVVNEASLKCLEETALNLACFATSPMNRARENRRRAEWQ